MTGPVAVIAERLAEIAAGLDGTAVAYGESSASWSRDGRVFAVVGETAITFDLGRQVARAAARTADAGPSARGQDWVELRPAMLDAYALDRAQAWFEAAWRRAGGA